jgi:hypothetical protein
LLARCRARDVCVNGWRKGGWATDAGRGEEGRGPDSKEEFYARHTWFVPTGGRVTEYHRVHGEEQANRSESITAYMIDIMRNSRIDCSRSRWRNEMEGPAS